MERIKQTPIIFIEKDPFTKHWLIKTCQKTESADGIVAISSHSNVLFDLQKFGEAEAIKAGVKIADAIKGIYSTGDPRK